jgi:hypothetical protein
MLPQNREEFGEFFLRKKKERNFSRNFEAVSPFCDSSPKKRVKDWCPLSIQSSHPQK